MLVREETKKLIIVYKEVGKEPELKKIEDTIEEKEKLVGGNLLVIPYEDILIVCNEELQNKKIRANIVFDNLTISGNFFAVADDFEHEELKSLTKEQVIRYFVLFKSKSFDYSNCDENGRILSKKEIKERKYIERQKQRELKNNNRLVPIEVNKSKTTLETNENQKLDIKKQNKTSYTSSTFPESNEENETDTLRMILAIQSVLLKYVKAKMKEYENSENDDK